jgi:hypothetical protein
MFFEQFTNVFRGQLLDYSQHSRSDTSARTTFGNFRDANKNATERIMMMLPKIILDMEYKI